MGHLVVGTAQLEREDRLKIFPLEPHIALESVAEVDSVRERGLVDNIVDLGC